jgi:hypothetical protein
MKDKKMSKTVTLKISDNTYELLRKASAEMGKTPEQVIMGWVESKVVQTSNDPLLQLAGAFESKRTDIAESHDSYIGETVRSNGS